jgi:hypothetical protein
LIIKINKLNPTFGGIFYFCKKVEMKEAYPIAINTSQMSWDAQNQYLVINIEMAFHEWESREPTVADYANVAIDAAQGEVARQIGNIL